MKEWFFFLILALSFLICACGKMETATESTAAVMMPAQPLPPVTQPSEM